MPFDFIERYGSYIELFGKADVAVFSCYAGQIKPEGDIYRTLIDKLALDPSEIVFFDDIEANVAGAREAGINAFLWTGLERAKEDFSAIGQRIVARI
jgi:putative hydrolase of the HAD superfamily